MVVAWIAVMRARWRPPEQPDRVLRIERTSDSGEKRIVFAGFVRLTGVEEGMAEFQARAPATALEGMPLPWSPPMAYSATDREGLEHWWRQIHYVFDLPDPRLFPSLPASALVNDDLATLARFVQTTADLSTSQMLSFDARFEFKFNKENEPYIAGANLPGRDLQAGFAVLLRQCLSPKDPANFDAVAKILDAALKQVGDARADLRLDELAAWTDAIEKLRQRSLEQLVRDRLVSEEDSKVFEYERATKPGKLLRTLNYGDLIHWGDYRGYVVAETDDEVESVMQRMDYFEAAAGLAHLLVGFGVLVRAATAAKDTIFIP
jgi:hypothetical protein